MIRNGFIMPDGHEYEVEETTHEEFAKMMLKRKEWSQTRRSATDTLVMDHGAIKVGGILSTKIITIHIRPMLTTNKMWEMVDLYRDEGYIVDMV